MQGTTQVNDDVSLQELADRIFADGHLNYHDRQRLKVALLDEFITDEELALVESVIEAVRQGRLTIG
jgi:hypothetical protein